MALEAVISLARILEQMLQHQHVVLEDRKLAEYLHKEVKSFLDTLENSLEKGSEELELLKSQIINSANDAKDIIESHIKSQLPSDTDSESVADENEISITISSKFLKEVRTGIHFIKRRVIGIEEEEGFVSSIASVSEGGHPNIADITVVGLDDDFQKIKDRLVRGSQQLEVVSVVGMGGIGKTTIVTKLYKDANILNRFDIQAWATVSQSYNVLETLFNLLDSVNSLTEEMRRMKDAQLVKERLYKNLKGRRYLIVLDDVWDSKVWDDLKQIFPNDYTASRILMTSRVESVVAANSCPPLHRMHILNEDKSWNLFCHKVFGEDCCPTELQEIGKNIVQICRGLPLAIVVLAGLFSKISRTQQHWGSIAENLSSEIIQNDDRCSKMVSLSYTHLPPHLKECFLYTCIFPEDFDIPVTKLVNLWIAEGFIKPVESRSLEDVAYSYLVDLFNRNLIMMTQMSFMYRIHAFKIHDLIRDFCIRETQKNTLFHVTDRSLYGIPVGATMRCLSVHPNETNIFPCDEKKLSSLLVSSIVTFDPNFHISKKLQNLGPLRVLDTEESIDDVGEGNGLELYNMRYLACEYNLKVFPSTSTCTVYRNLQTLNLHGAWATPVKEVAIWNMPELRHVKVDRLQLCDTPEGENSTVVLEHLQTLSQLQNFRCSKEVLKRIPNLKKLSLCYSSDADLQQYYLNNLVDLHKLEKLGFVGSVSHIYVRMHDFTFPPSLKELSLRKCNLAREEMHVLGCLPNLQVLRLKFFLFDDGKWEPAEGEFSSLEFLRLKSTNLGHWKADGDHFQSLQGLILSDCRELTEIPRGIGDIPTLQSIKLHNCDDSLVACVKEIRDEQRELGNDVLQVHIRHSFITKESIIRGWAKAVKMAMELPA